MVFADHPDMLGIFSKETAPEPLRKDPSAQLRRPDEHDRARLRGAVAALPPMIDCANALQVQDLARGVGDPILKQLLEVLANLEAAAV